MVTRPRAEVSDGIEKDDKYFEIAKKRIEDHLTYNSQKTMKELK